MREDGSARGERHHGLDTPLDFRCGKRCPTSEAMADDSNRAIKQQMIQKKAYIGHTVRDPGFRSRRFLFGGLTVLAPQLRRHEFRVIECRDNIAVAA